MADSKADSWPTRHGISVATVSGLACCPASPLAARSRLTAQSVEAGCDWDRTTEWRLGQPGWSAGGGL